MRIDGCDRASVSQSVLYYSCDVEQYVHTSTTTIPFFYLSGLSTRRASSHEFVQLITPVMRGMSVVRSCLRVLRACMRA